MMAIFHQLCWPHAMSGWYAQPCTESAGTKVGLSFDWMHYSVSAEILSFPPGEFPIINEREYFYEERIG
jgi:hypothetical protein